MKISIKSRAEGTVWPGELTESSNGIPVAVDETGRAWGAWECDLLTRDHELCREAESAGYTVSEMYQVQIGKVLVEDDGWKEDLGRVVDDFFLQTWWELPLPSCPDCKKGELVWAGTDTWQCDSCDSLFSTKSRSEPDGMVAYLRRERLY